MSSVYLSRVCYVKFLVCLGFVMSCFCLSRVGFGISLTCCTSNQNRFEFKDDRELYWIWLSLICAPWFPRTVYPFVSI